MNKATKTLVGAAAIGIVLAFSSAAFAQSIAGNWKTAAGADAVISKCGSSYCVQVTSGEHAGKNIGRMKGSGNSYAGTITDPSNGKSYSGSAKVSGAVLKMKGCALKVFCRTQTWKRR